MSTAPNLYYLFFKRNNCNEYDVFESHRCQDPGCLMTNDEFVGTCLPGKVEEFVNEFSDKCREFGDKLENYEVDGYIKVEQ